MGIVIQVRGTSGSGKTTVVRRVMERLGTWEPMYIPRRKNPLYYRNEDPCCIVLGSYVSVCGGCDNIGSAPAVYSLIQSVRKKNADVPILCEGLLLSEDVKWSSQIPNLRVLFLTTPLEQCLENTRNRRLAAGNTKELNPKNTINRGSVIERARVKLEEAGVDCRRCGVEQAVTTIVRWVKNA